MIEGTFTLGGLFTGFTEGALLGRALTLGTTVVGGAVTEEALGAAGTTSTTCAGADVVARILFVLVICEIVAAALGALTLAALLFALVLALALAMIGGATSSGATLTCASTIFSSFNSSTCFSSMVPLTVSPGLTERT